MPPTLPPERTAAAVAAMAGGSGGQLQQTLAKQEKTISETSRNGKLRS